MKTKHTPGSWKVLHPYISDNKNAAIAKVQAAGDECGAIIWRHESAADLENVFNAALIAASPDLLDALQRIVDHLELDQSFAGDHALEVDDPGHAEQCPVCMAKAAIRKATGEA